MIDRVFIVTSGAYSDYMIESVWTTREAAEAHIVRRNPGEYAFVEEWLVNEQAERTVVQWAARTDPSGEILVASRPVETSSPTLTNVAWNSRWGIWDGNGYGPSPEHARKSLADAIAKAKAESVEQEKI